MFEFSIPPEVVGAVEATLDPGDLKHAVEYEGYNPCELAEIAIHAALEALGIREERMEREDAVIDPTTGALAWTKVRFVSEWRLPNDLIARPDIPAAGPAVRRR